MPSRRLADARRKHVLYRERQQALVDLFGGACHGCGYNRSLTALCFHHTDPTKKTRGFNARRWSQKDITPEFVEELAGCRLLCANCHAEEHERLAYERLFGPSGTLDSGLQEVHEGMESREESPRPLVQPLCAGT